MIHKYRITYFVEFSDNNYHGETDIKQKQWIN
jgi:hypothetical protein